MAEDNKNTLQDSLDKITFKNKDVKKIKDSQEGKTEVKSSYSKIMEARRNARDGSGMPQGLGRLADVRKSTLGRQFMKPNEQ